MAKEIKYIDILDKVLDPKYWVALGWSIHYSGHSNRHSPVACDDSCETCDGVMCDCCDKIVEPNNLRCALPSGVLEEILISKGVPSDIADHMAYDGTDYDPNEYGYSVIWPEADEFKEKYPVEYQHVFAVISNS